MPRPVHFELQASEPQVLIDFYQGLFGWRFESWGNEGYWLIMTGDSDPSTGEADSTPGINGGLLLRNSPRPKPGEGVNAAIITVDVADCRASLDTAVATGATVAMDVSPVPGIGWVAYFIDPDGNLMGMMQSDESATRE